MTEPYYQSGPATIFEGDCIEIMRTLPDASFDAVVTDPPYSLSFMGREWDSWRDGASFEAWCCEWGTECFRLLKPGGHLLAFGGSRTWHRLAAGIEDAGFEIRDSIAWLYGCLTADADVLTDRGWVNGLGVREGDLVAQWDHDTGRITLAPVERTFRAPWDGPMRVLRSSDTDQVLTPNHRVYHQTYEREQSTGARTGSWSAWKVAEAGSLSTWQATRLPIAGTHDGPGIGGEDYAALLGWVWTEGGFDQSGSGVRIYQSSVNPEKCDEIAALLDRMGPHKRYDYARTYTRRNGQTHQYTATTWFISGDIANRVREDLPGKRPTYDLLWRMTAAEKRAMLRAAMLGDGSGWGGSSPQFYQKHEDDLVWLQTLLALIDQAGKVTMRGDRQGGQLSLRQRGTTDLQARHLRNSTEHYTGEVWCVKVPSGAFLARRNGHVFITGNSGFPKSLDVSKAIDKVRDDAAAAAWEGWGTALKPSFEPIVVARKPLAGTVAANVLAHGTGALNIDATRVQMSAGDRERINSMGGFGTVEGFTPNAVFGKFGASESRAHDEGRWPTNVLMDESQAAELDAQSGVLTSGLMKARTERQPRPGGTIYGADKRNIVAGDTYADSRGASRFFPTFRYEAKAPTSERPVVDGVQHPTVKPLDLMAWLCRLVTPPGGIILEPFAGSGTTVEAALSEGFEAVGIEREADYLPLIVSRLSKPIEQTLDLGGDAA